MDLVAMMLIAIAISAERLTRSVNMARAVGAGMLISGVVLVGRAILICNDNSSSSLYASNHRYSGVYNTSTVRANYTVLYLEPEASAEQNDTPSIKESLNAEDNLGGESSSALNIRGVRGCACPGW